MSLSADRRAASALLLRQLTSEEEGRLDVWLRAEAQRLKPEERRRVHALVYGVNRHLTLLQRHLDPFLKRPLHQQDPELQVALLLGAYELRYQDSVPDRAAVHQAVELIRRLGHPRKTGLVNAVLRKIARGEAPPALPARQEDPLGWAEAATSHPRWLLDVMADAVGPVEAAAWAETNNLEPPLTIRLREDDAKLVEELGGTPSDLVGGAVTLTDRPRGPIDALPGFEEGRWWVQDAGAQAVVAMMGLRPGMRVLDACAAPGGKTICAAVAVGPEGRVVSVDRSARRLRLLERNTERLGLANVTIEVRDLLTDPWPEDDFDVVLLDAPCSGLGVVRRHPEIRWNRQPRDAVKQGARQRTLLASVAPAVAPGGALVYSVCTFMNAETDQVIDAFCGTHPGFAVADPRALVPPVADALLDGSVLRTFPHRHDADAFFGVRLERRS